MNELTANKPLIGLASGKKVWLFNLSRFIVHSLWWIPVNILSFPQDDVLDVFICDTTGKDDIYINDKLVEEGFAEFKQGKPWALIKGNGNIIFYFSHLKELLRLYIIHSYRIFISCLLILLAQYFLSRQPLIILHSIQNYTLSALRNIKTFKTSTNQYLVSNEYFCMVNPCCYVTKTTVNEIKNLSKMADISFIQPFYLFNILFTQPFSPRLIGFLFII